MFTVYISFTEIPDGKIFSVNHNILFKNIFKEEWLLNELSKRAIRDIENAEYKGVRLFYSNKFKEYFNFFELSSGTKSLILLDNVPNVIIRSSRLGDNCYKLLEEYLIEHKDKNIHLLLDSYFPYLDSQSFIDIETGMVYNDKEELF